MYDTDALRRRRAAARARQVRRRRLVVGALIALVAVAVIAAVSVGSGSSRHGGQPFLSAKPAKPRHVGPHYPITLTVEASGDLLIHGPVFERALADGGGQTYNFDPMFAAIKPIVRSVDLPLCHVETPLTSDPPIGYPSFSTPPALAKTIRDVGFRACSTAATHSLDRGQSGIDQTIKYLDQAGVLHAGTYSSAAAAATPLIFKVKGVRVAFLSYTDITNGLPSPHPWSVHRADATQIIAEARRARAAGAQVVIVNLHWGDQYIAQPNTFQLNLTRALTADPYITAIVGQHVHVPQPVREINGKLVVFGEGNLISNQTAACCPAISQAGLIAILTIKVYAHSSRVTFVHYIPVWVRHPDYEILPAGLSIRSDPADAESLRSAYQAVVATAGRAPNIQPIPASLP